MIDFVMLRSVLNDEAETFIKRNNIAPLPIGFASAHVFQQRFRFGRHLYAADFALQNLNRGVLVEFISVNGQIKAVFSRSFEAQIIELNE